jgi:hypothetical protein
VSDFLSAARLLAQRVVASPDARLKFFSLTQVPLLFLVQPKLVRVDSEACEVRINLNYLTRNHLNSMYFGTQAIGADIVVGLLAMEIAEQQGGAQVVPIFKNFNAQFLKRAEGDLLFVCNSGAQVGQMVIQAAESGERVTADVEAEARLISTNEVVSKFILGLSLKVKNAAKNTAKKGAM